MQDRVEQNIVESLIRLAPQIFKSHSVDFAYLYGSVATGYVHPFSDLDIAIYTHEMPHAKSLKLELSLSLAIDEKLAVNLKSEVRTMNNLPLIVNGQIISEGILIYSANEVERVDFETRIRLAYFDFLPVIQSYQEMYLEKALS